MDYKTRQREAIFSYIEQQKSRYVTAAELSEHFKKSGTSIGLTTIYRHLDKLVEKTTGIKTTVAKNPVSCVALGTGMLLDDLSSRQEGTLNLARERRMRL